jgi:hypothetical protein
MFQTTNQMEIETLMDFGAEIESRSSFSAGFLGLLALV